MTVDAPKQVRFSKDIKVEREIISTSKQVKFKTEDFIKEEPGRDLSTKIEVIDEETLGQVQVKSSMKKSLSAVKSKKQASNQEIIIKTEKIEVKDEPGNDDESLEEQEEDIVVKSEESDDAYEPEKFKDEIKASRPKPTR